MVFFLNPTFDVGVYKTAPLRVDSTGTHVNGEGNYGFCSSTCTAVSLFDLIGNLLGEIFFLNCDFFATVHIFFFEPFPLLLLHKNAKTDC